MIDVKSYVDRSVLCWLATVDEDNFPNVSPKEVFTLYKEQNIIIANIASPNSMSNILSNAKVCVSFIDILVQKGCKVKGVARVVTEADSDYKEMEKQLLEITKGNYLFSSIFCIRIEDVKPIIAPSYLLYPDMSMDERIQNAKENYKL